MPDETLAVLHARLEAEVRALEERADRFETKLDEVLAAVTRTNETLASWRGGGQVALIASSAIAFLVSLVTSLFVKH